MEAKTPDFSGYATKVGLKCTDGRTILKDAFAHQNSKWVPLVWGHGHGEPTNILGKVQLENRADGVYAKAYCNDTPNGKAAKIMVQHGDIESFSIYANKLVEQSMNVIHGAIKEVSLVIAGANPGAKIDFVAVQHSDGDITELEDEAVIYNDKNIEHSEIVVDETDDEDEDAVEHADDKTVKDIYDSLSQEQKDVVDMMIGAALETSAAAPVAHSEDGTDENAEAETPADSTDDGDTAADDNNEGDVAHQEGNEMTRNAFEQNGAVDTVERPTLSHDALVEIVKEGQKSGSFKDALSQHFIAHAADYGIDDISLLFPDAKALASTPELISRRMEWVAKVLDGTKHTPFAKIKSVVADITAEEARAKGYIKGNQKKDEVVKLLRRTTGPATVYKKQRLDRDDIIDITELDVVAWLWGEIRLMLEEEVARAILVGDGRDSLSEDKVKDPEGAVDGVGIRSVLHDSDLYSVKYPLAANVAPKDAVKGLVRARSKYRGSGKPTLFVSDSFLTDLMLEEDKFGRALYETEQVLADKLRVESIVTVDLFDETADLVAIMVNLMDYNIGANAGGELTKFDDFDIDFNQYKYLLETRLSGALTKPFSAVVVTRELGVLAVATQPTYNPTTHVITIPTATGVTYTIDDEPVTGTKTITETTEVEAHATDGHYLESGTTRTWVYSV